MTIAKRNLSLGTQIAQVKMKSQVKKKRRTTMGILPMTGQVQCIIPVKTVQCFQKCDRRESKQTGLSLCSICNSISSWSVKVSGRPTRGVLTDSDSVSGECWDFEGKSTCDKDSETSSDEDSPVEPDQNPRKRKHKADETFATKPRKPTTQSPLAGTPRSQIGCFSTNQVCISQKWWIFIPVLPIN